MQDLDNTIVLDDADGNSVEFEFLDLIEYLGKEYVVLLPKEDEDGEVVILQVDENESEDEESYVSVEDESIVAAVFAIFKDKFKDEFNFTDGETPRNGKVKYRSRLGLWAVAWISAWLGGHLNWLGYKEQGSNIREQFGGIAGLFNISCWIFHVWEQIAILFGKYRTDANGNPVRYFALLRNILSK